jgi:hypothetical protein
VESNLVLVHVEVYDKFRIHAANPARQRCRSVNTNIFYKLAASESFLPLDCFRDVTIRGLTANEFHLFEDGVEQKIESAKLDRWAWISARDNFVSHEEWSYAPLGKWGTVDQGVDWSPSPANYFYQLSYVPTNREEGKCRHVRVKVDKPRAVVYAGDQYCYTAQPSGDPLNGTKFGQQLQANLDLDRRAKIPLSVQVSFFYTEAQRARVEIDLAFPWDKLTHKWVGGELHATIGALGIVEKKDRSVTTRFSDLACCISGSQLFATFSYDPDLSANLQQQLQHIESAYLPSTYNRQIDLPTGEEFKLRVVLSDGRNFGRAEVPLVIDSYDGKRLAISSVALCKRFRDAGAAAQEDAAANLAPQYVPLVSKGVRVTPTADTTFKRNDPLIAYFEVYEPLLSQQPKTAITAHMRITDPKTGMLTVDFPPLDAAPYERPGSTMIPIGDELVVSQLPKGDYRLEVQATDSAGRSTPWRTANFTLE